VRLQESDGSVYITETNKTVARTHLIDGALLSLLLHQDSVAQVAGGNLTYTFTAGDKGRAVAAPTIPPFDGPWQRGLGLTLGLWLANHGGAAAGQTLFTSVAAGNTSGVSIEVVPGGALRCNVSDGVGAATSLPTDSLCTARLLDAASDPHYVAFVVDGGAHVLSVSVDGMLCDGATESLQGWTFLPATTHDLSGSAAQFTVGGTYTGTFAGGHVYSRYLQTSEAVGNYRAGPPAL